MIHSTRTEGIGRYIVGSYQRTQKAVKHEGVGSTSSDGCTLNDPPPKKKT